MKFSLSSKNARKQSSQNLSWFDHAQHPERRSIAAIPSGDGALGPFSIDGPDDFGQTSPPLSLGLSRSQTVLRREGAASSSRHGPSLSEYHPGASSPVWSPNFSDFPTPREQPDTYHDSYLDSYHDQVPMSGAPYNTAPGKTSSDSGQSATLDRWSQRRLQRLNTEQGFREQRQGGQGVLSPPLGSEQASYSSGGGTPYPAPDTQPHPSLHQQHQPLPVQPSIHQSSRTVQGANPNAGLAIQAPSTNNPLRSPSYPQVDPAQAHVQASQQYSPPELAAPYISSSDSTRPQPVQSRSYSQQQVGADETSMSSNNGSMPPPKAPRSAANNRQSVHNGMSARDATGQQGMPAYISTVVPAAGQGQNYKGGQGQQQGDVGRATPQPAQLGEDMTEEDVTQLIKDHKELREKYTKVKKYYFEKEDQVKQLQNSLAHQRLSLSRTSLDDSEYSTRFNRLDGLVAQLSFSIRKSWRSIPQWLAGSVNKDAVAVGKQEMTATGRAFISYWLVEEVFNRYFHPDLEMSMSAQLKAIQLNIRKFAPPAQTVEEEEFLTQKVVNWRLSTLEGLQDALRSPQCSANRTHLTDYLKDHLISAIAQHLQDPPPSDLEGGVHMIIELVVSILIHLPLESRDVLIEYFMPGYSIMAEQMKLEAGIPPLTVSIADEQADRASLKSVVSDMTDIAENNHPHGEQPKKRSMLSAITGTGGKNKSSAQGKHSGASGSSSSLNRPESAQGSKDDLPPRVRMAAGIGVQVRGRSVLVKAPVFAT